MATASVTAPWPADILQRMARAVEKVQERLLRATSALEAESVQYAVAGGNAVASWVAMVDRGAVRNTPDVDILLLRSEFEQAKAVLERAGFVYWQTRGLDIFRDGPDSSVRDSVHVLFASEKLTGEELVANPGIEESERGAGFRVLTLEALVRTKLNAWRLKDQVHLQDMLEVGLIDESWVGRFPPELGERLQQLIDNPEG
jgi:hypothetical protein